MDELRRTGASFVIATGHFVRHASYALFTGMTIPQRIAIVTLPSSDVSRPTSFNSRLNALHKDLVMDVWEVRRRRVPHRRQRDVWSDCRETSREPGNVVIISSDAYAGLDGRVVHQRPFAGWRLRRVALGTAMIARFAQVPVVLCHPYVEPDGTVVLEWDGPIRAKDEGSDGDIELMDAVLDGLERMVGKRPNQYVYPIGGERTWIPTPHGGQNRRLTPRVRPWPAALRTAPDLADPPGALRLDEGRDRTDGSEVPRHQVLIGDGDSKLGLEERDQLNHPERVDHAVLDQRVVVSELVGAAVPGQVPGDEAADSLLVRHVK